MNAICKNVRKIQDERIRKFKNIMLLVAAVGVALLSPSLVSAASVLASAQDFAVLGASTVTNTGSTTIYGNVGLYPGTSITGFPPGVVTGGTIHTTDAVAQQARLDTVNAYNTLSALPSPFNLTGQDLGERTLTPGVYHFDTTAQLTGVLTLDFLGNPNADFVFQIGTALTTAPGSSVNVLNGSSQSGVYWLMGVTGGSGTGSATLDTSTMFAGNILALDSITLNTTAAILCGRAIALNGAVTMDTNRISNDNSLEDFGSGRPDFGSVGFSGGSGGPTTVPEPSTMLLLGSGMAGLVILRKRFKKA